MLEQSWEAYASALANCATTADLLKAYESIATQLRINVHAPAAVVYAYDTRPSGPALIKALETSLGAYGHLVKATNIGITTTPVLHYVVKAINDKTGEYGKPTIEGYYEKLANAFKTVIVCAKAYRADIRETVDHSSHCTLTVPTAWEQLLSVTSKSTLATFFP